MNLTRIEYFVAVAKSESFTVAAQSLYTTQPNLSKQISLMEQELGFPLFHRGGRGITLTPAGRYLYEQFKDIPEQAARAVAHARALSRGDTRALTVGLLEGQDIHNALAEGLRDFQDRNRRVELDMERRSFSQLRQGLDDGRYDLIITLSFELLPTPELCSQVLIHQQGAIAISRRHPLAAKERPSLADLRKESFVAIAPKESPGGYAKLFEQCAQMGFSPRVVREATNLESMLLCVETGVGVAIVDRNTRLEHNENIRIIPLPESAVCDVVAVWKRANQNPMLLALVDCLNLNRPVLCRQ